MTEPTAPNPKHYTEVFADTSVQYMLGDVVSRASKWAPMENAPRLVDVPRDLEERYLAIVGEWIGVQIELRKLYDAAPPNTAVRPPSPGPSGG